MEFVASESGWSGSGAENAAFDMLRSRIEVELSRPAVVVITASGNGDYKETTCRRLAQSFFVAGYKTALIDATSVATRSARADVTVESEVFKQLEQAQPAGRFTTLNLNDAVLQQRNGARNVAAAIALLREKFEYSVVSAEYGLATSFATAMAGAADAVVVTVKSGRRENRRDRHLAELLRRPEMRFLGLVSIGLGEALPDDHFAALSGSDSRHGRSVIELEKEYGRRVAVESAG